MMFPRESGILLHPTSLPGPFGSGDFGPEAFRFVDWMQAAGQRLWQVMPLGPTGYGDSPYASPSAFAGNPLLVSLTWLKGEGLLDDSDLDNAPAMPADQVDFSQVYPYRMAKLEVAFNNFRRGRGALQRAELEEFSTREAGWLDTYALFMAVKLAHDQLPWQAWDERIRLREPEALVEWSQRLQQEIRFQKFIQFQFDRQWKTLRRYANEREVRIIGDIPIFVSDDSADVWANRGMFRIDERGEPIEVAGVPPDPFSATGQIWGNPAFDWKAMRDDDYGWWTARIGRMLDTVDIVRIDHFRAFAAAWLVPAGAETAAVGQWERSPGAEVFAAIKRTYGDVPVIIEDLGVITPDVIALREVLGFPGMNVLQFAFDDDPRNVYLPHNYRRDSVVYTGTHDNQTTMGWFLSRSDVQKQAVQRYLGKDGSDIAWDFIRIALASVSSTAILPLQDVMRLGDEARMNVPGELSGNWSWRYQDQQLDYGLAAGLREQTAMYGRLASPVDQRSPNPWDYTRADSAHTARDPFIID